MYSEKLTNALVKFVVIAIAIKLISMGGIFNSKVYKGDGYTILPPAGWAKVKEKKGVAAVEQSSNKPNIVTFITPEKNIATEIPEASLSILSVKLTQSIWIEDEFPTIIENLVQEGNQIMNQGQIMIDTLITHWVLYQEPASSFLILEFYAVTDANKFYKIQFMATEEGFNRYRQAFEASKATIKFSTSLF